MKLRIALIVVAAGEGSRLPGPKRKVFLSLGGKSVLLHSIACFRETAGIEQTIVALHPSDLAWAQDALKASFDELGVTDVVSGGATRTQTVRKCLEVVGADANIVIIHDGARPLASPKVIDACVAQAAEFGGAIAAAPMQPTVKKVDGDGFIVGTLPREALWAAHTPQVFRREVLEKAYARVGEATEQVLFTDDAAAVELSGERVKVVEGTTANIKITTAADLIMAEALLEKLNEGEKL